MNKNLEKFLELVKNDAELQKKLNGANSIEEQYALASATVSGFSLDEFATMPQQNPKDGITDEALGTVAGGQMGAEEPDSDTWGKKPNGPVRIF